ncbi:MAG TPA: hypothetical protein PK677_17910, partial [Acidiphilium sp.]|nr:hypothetical protein [Acidiphilium sp.]
MSGSGVPIDGTTIIDNNGAVAVAPTLVDAANQGPVAAQAAATAQSAANAAALVAGAAIPSAKINAPNGVLGLDANGTASGALVAPSGLSPATLAELLGGVSPIALAAASTAATQAALDSSTKIATTAYSDAAVAVETKRAEAAEQT